MTHPTPSSESAEMGAAAKAKEPFVRSIAFSAAYDKRDPNPSKNYGVHGVGCVFTVSKGGRGVTFELFTNWMLPNVQAETDAREPGHGSVRYMFHKPQPAYVAYHDTKPHHEGQSCTEKCEVTGGKCYSDGSGVMADDVYLALLEKGSDGVFAFLEQRYADWLESEAA